jgi:DNA repair protein RecN (Recombination protein N)
VAGESLHFDPSGIDDVIFRFAPNQGEPARPLARIASGGELSRVALAIKEVLAAADATPTLVFDEIDTGIGGRSADPVGRSLWSLARRHQVLCVTHLPQIAAHADVHFRISKRERDGRTVTEVERLDSAARLTELALMLGGEGVDQGPDRGAAARAGAEQLLARAAAWRANLAEPASQPAGVA